jgi:hypothetical protein
MWLVGYWYNVGITEKYLADIKMVEVTGSNLTGI